MNLRPSDVAVLVCPTCHGSLQWEGRTRGGLLDEGWLRCAGCRAAWPVSDGTPRLYREEQVRGTDRLLRVFYDGLPGLYEPLTAWLTPLLQGASEAELRERYLHRLELGSLQPRREGAPVRILDIGTGTGANLPLLERGLPRGLDVEVWGIDLSAGMLAECRERLARGRHAHVRLLQADAHALPFPDHFFDRVLEVGGIGGYRDARTALAERARVARRGTPIVTVDEQLDPGEPHSLLQRGAFRALTFYSRRARCPRELLPPEAMDIREEQVSRFYFCLTFRMPAATSPRPSGEGRGEGSG
ncbi:MAG: methyltransferase domain-containing protein [Archangium sp.]